MPTSPTAPTAVPDFPAVGDAAYNTKAYAWATHMDTVYPGEMSALATVTHSNAVESAASAAASATQVGLAAAQVTLAADQAALADADRIQTAADRVQTGLDRVQTGLDRIATAADVVSAAALLDQFDDRYLGVKAADPTLDNDGNALDAGAIYVNSVSGFLRAYTGSVWVQGISAIAGVSSVNGAVGDVTVQPTLVSGTNIKTINSASLLGAGNIVISGGARVVPYISRATLRGLTPAADDQAIVEGLGLFVWESGSTEPDDDESCFATATGRWLLQAASWDLVDAWQAYDDAARDEFDAAEPSRFASNFSGKVLTGSATCAITSVAATTSTSFTGTVTGAAVGDRVVATPPDELGSTNLNTSRLGYHAWVSAANTVTVMLTNSTATSATTNTAVRTAWPITVIKS